MYRIGILCFSVQCSSCCYYTGSSINDKLSFLAVHDGIFHFPIQHDVIISCINVINIRSTVYILNKNRKLRVFSKRIKNMRYLSVFFSNSQKNIMKMNVWTQNRGHMLVLNNLDLCPFHISSFCCSSYWVILKLLHCVLCLKLAYLVLLSFSL